MRLHDMAVMDSPGPQESFMRCLRPHKPTSKICIFLTKPLNVLHCLDPAFIFGIPGAILWNKGPCGPKFKNLCSSHITSKWVSLDLPSCNFVVETEEYGHPVTFLNPRFLCHGFMRSRSEQGRPEGPILRVKVKASSM